MNSYSLYEILRVPPKASQAEIKAAYRQLSKTYHPDVNPTEDARKRMPEINRAYEILGNPTKRAAYDAAEHIRNVGNEQQAADPTVFAREFTMRVRCQRCGKFDNTLRLSVFPYVISVLLVTFKRAKGGLFCEKCRSFESTKWAAVSLLFGPWGFPWGIIYTIEALFKNAKGGHSPRSENVELLKQLAWVLVALGRIGEAKAALKALIKIDYSISAISFLRDLDSRFSGIKPARGGSFRYGFASVVLAIFAVYYLVGHAFFGSPSNSQKYSVTTNVQSTTIPENYQMTTTYKVTVSPTSAPSKSQSTITVDFSKVYADKIETLLNEYSTAQSNFLSATSSMVTYDQAVANAGIFTAACLQFQNSGTAMANSLDLVLVPEYYASFHRALKTWITASNQYINALDLAVNNRSANLWNRAVELGRSAEQTRQTALEELKKLN